jgi:hypothetical protein
VAFYSLPLQKFLAQLENKKLRKKLAKIKSEAPVFISSLPRSGTSVLHQALEKHPSLVSQTYEDMPFPLCPTWNKKLTKKHQPSAIERLHGDGIKITPQSPGALEELLWRATGFTNSNSCFYERSKSLSRSEAEFIRHHFKKVILANKNPEAHYLSKNNANLSRLSLIKILFPQSRIITLFRAPLAQAQSLLEQHLNFSKIQSEDRFTKSYMNYLGHQEFGELHNPLDLSLAINTEAFPETLTQFESEYEKEDINYWLEYWCFYYNCVYQNVEQFILINFENLCSHPDAELTQLFEKMNISIEPSQVALLTKSIHQQSNKNISASFDTGIYEKAEALHKLLLRSVN